MMRLPWLRRFTRVDLVDHFQVHTRSGSVAVEADRAVLRGIWQKETADCASVHLLGPHSLGTLAKTPDASLDCLYLPGEVAPDWMVPALPLWLAKLKDGAVVCGDLFSTPHWPDSTYGLSLLLGVPDSVSATGFWWKRFHRPAAAGLPPRQPPQEPSGPSSSTAEPLLWRVPQQRAAAGCQQRSGPRPPRGGSRERPSVPRHSSRQTVSDANCEGSTSAQPGRLEPREPPRERSSARQRATVFPQPRPESNSRRSKK